MRLIVACAAAILVLAGGRAGAVEVKEITSPGGLTAWLVEDHTVPLVSIEFSFRGGASLDPEGREGLADMTSSLIDEGAGDLDSQAFQGILQNNSITVRFSAGMDTFRGSMKALNKHRDQAADLVALALTQPRFDEEPVERIRSQILVGLERDKANPRAIAGDTWWHSAFPAHPYGRPSEGTVETVSAITADDMRRFVADRFAKDQLLIGVVGDVTPEEAGALIDRAFGALPDRAAPFEVPDTDAAASGETIVVSFPTPQAVIVFGHAGILRKDPDYYAASVMNHVLGGGGFGSRLTEEIREKRGLVYSVYSGLTPLRHAGVFTGGLATDNAQAGQALDLVRAEWARMQAEGATPEEVADAITFMTGSFPLRFDRSDRVARMLVGMQYNDLGIDYFETRNRAIEAVTVEDVRRVAERLLDPERLTVVVVGEPQGVTATQERAAPGG